MKFDITRGAGQWAQTAALARAAADAGVSGLVFTETTQAPWMSVAAAATVAPELEFATGVAVAFPRSPMVTAVTAWELAANTRGRFRLGLGTQVRAHVERRYSSEFDHPGPRLKDYVLAVRDCFASFDGRKSLNHEGPYYRLSLLPQAWTPARHDHGDIKIDISAVGPWMCRMAGEVADGVHVHPLHSLHYLHERLLPAVGEGCLRAGRSPAEVDLIVPVFIVAGDTAEERAPLRRRAQEQISFYGSTRAYAFQFDDLGFTGLSAALNERLKANDLDGMRDLITDEVLDEFAVVGRWDEIADTLTARYGGIATRLVSYLAEDSVQKDPTAIARWGEIARALDR
ncbi:TIGR03617 family F420-dependent LLM class oxidoreductase [Nocardia sp. CA-135953]|uniref:TIGR03617 family F420-dependent LLM class oxidoreductase n=1 Tax=Nocardia sp. CA-135953 TaxID=3239978 RepID=UPI003D951B05